MSSKIEGTILNESLVSKLSEFGLTKNQAKVYLTIVQLGLTEVGSISKISMIHRQDVYKIIPILEKSGLVVRLIGKPVSFEALPITLALGKFIAIEEKKAKERIKKLKRDLKELNKAVIPTIKEEPIETPPEPRFTLLSTDKQLTNTLEVMYEEAKEKVDMVLSTQILKGRERHFRYNLQKIAKRGVITRLIIEDPKIEDETMLVLERIRPKGGSFTAKFIRKKTVPYRIVDGKDLLVSRRIMTESGMPQLLWTDSGALIEFYSAQFEEDWNNPEAINLTNPKEEKQIILKAKKK